MVASAGASVFDDGTTPPGEPATLTFVWYYYGTFPAKHQLDLASVLQAGWPVTITDNEGGHYSTALSSIDLIPGAPAAHYKVIVPNIQAGIDTSTTPPTPIYLWDIRTKLNILSFYPPPSDVNPWPTGTVLRSADTTYVYAISALPSKAVQRVEGFGSIDDASGTGRKDFVILGQARSVSVVGSTTTTVYSDEFTVNLNDSTWNASGLGRDITTITFPKAPRDTLSVAAKLGPL
jgi:hypothetical protein